MGEANSWGYEWIPISRNDWGRAVRDIIVNVVVVAVYIEKNCKAISIE